ncbi:hypothetical protein Dimus_018285 [Dionaea muscipula]
MCRGQSSSSESGGWVARRDPPPMRDLVLFEHSRRPGLIGAWGSRSVHPPYSDPEESCSSFLGGGRIFGGRCSSESNERRAGSFSVVDVEPNLGVLDFGGGLVVGSVSNDPVSSSCPLSVVEHPVEVLAGRFLSSGGSFSLASRGEGEVLGGSL